MTVNTLLNLAFDNIGAHLSNLDQVRSIIQEISSRAKSITDIIQLLEEKMEEGDVTLRTDIRILINEVRHLSEKRPTS
ncbi:MAG: hypothetical protein RTU30_07525 [Candidatus Thorarchaeota archaeon]